MTMKCENCVWKGEDQPLGYGGFPHCPVCGQSIRDYKTVGKKESPKEEPIVDFDINKDGKVDKEDISLMAKGLRKLGGKKSKPKKRR